MAYRDPYTRCENITYFCNWNPLGFALDQLYAQLEQCTFKGKLAPLPSAPLPPENQDSTTRSDASQVHDDTAALESQLRAKETEVARAKKNLSETQDALAQMQATRNDIQNQLTEKEAEVAQLQDRLTSMRGELEVAEASTAGLRDDLGQAHAERDDLAQRLQAKNAELSAFDEQLQTARSELTQAKARLEAQLSEVDETAYELGQVYTASEDGLVTIWVRAEASSRAILVGETPVGTTYLERSIPAAGAKTSNGRTASAWAFPEEEPAQSALLADDTAANDQFGISVSLSGDTALVGAHYKDANGANSGAAYIFVRHGDTWQQQGGPLVLDDGATNDYFGHAVSLSGDTALVGAHYKDAKGGNSGAAYIFVRQGDSWLQQGGPLVPDDGAANDQFGVSVSLSGDTALVGAHYKDAKGTNSGAAYIFIRQGDSWQQQGGPLVPDDGAASDYFGHAVSLSGDTALIGAYTKDAKGNNSGAAYIFVRHGDSWQQQGKPLVPYDGAASDYFGHAVSLSGDTALIGAYNKDAKGSNSGAAYIFVPQGDSWQQQGWPLAPHDGASGDYFGYAVSLSGNTALVGAYAKDVKGNNSGAAYIFNAPSDQTEAPVPDPHSTDAASTVYEGFVMPVQAGDTWSVRLTAVEGICQGGLNWQVSTS